MSGTLIDVNATLGHWPFQPFAIATAEELDHHLEEAGIGEAWVAALESVLYPDPDIYDALLAQRLAGFSRLVPVKTINPTLSNWQTGLDTAVTAIRLYPNYHRYRLNDERLHRVLADVQRRGLIVQMPLRIDDERNQSPLMMVPAVSIEELLPLAHLFPHVSFLVLNAYFNEAVQLLGGPGNLYVDTAFAEHPMTLRALLQHANEPDRVLFGSHTPMLYTRSAILKLDTAENDEVRDRIGRANARRLSRNVSPARSQRRHAGAAG